MSIKINHYDSIVYFRHHRVYNWFVAKQLQCTPQGSAVHRICVNGFTCYLNCHRDWQTTRTGNRVVLQGAYKIIV